MRSRAVSLPLLCWLSMACGPPPSRIFSSSFRTCETRSARKRMLASKRAEVGSTRDSTTGEVACGPGSLRSAMDEESKLFTVYQHSGKAQTPVSAAETLGERISDARFQNL